MAFQDCIKFYWITALALNIWVDLKQACRNNIVSSGLNQFLEVEWLIFVLLLHILRLIELLDSQWMGFVFGHVHTCKCAMDKSACRIMSWAFRGLWENAPARGTDFQTNQSPTPGLQWCKCRWYRHNVNSNLDAKEWLFCGRQELTRLHSQCVYHMPLAVQLTSNAYRLRTAPFVPSCALDPNGLFGSSFSVERIRCKKSIQARPEEKCREEDNTQESTVLS